MAFRQSFDSNILEFMIQPSKLSDSELRAELQQYSLTTIGPITRTTRKIYEKQLKAFQTRNSDANKKTKKATKVSTLQKPVTSTTTTKNAKFEIELDKKSDFSNNNSSSTSQTTSKRNSERRRASMQSADELFNSNNIFGNSILILLMYFLYFIQF